MGKTDQLTDADLVLRLQVLRKHGGKSAPAAHELGISTRALGQSVTAAKVKGLTADSVIRDPLELAKQEVKRLKLELSAIRKQNDNAETIRREIYKLRELPLDPPAWLNSTAKIEGPGTPMMVWSDWHWGEVVEKGEVGGLNQFDSAVAAQRAELLTDRFLGLVRHHMPKGVSGAVICLGGDMITGEIHQELAETNDQYVLESVRELKNVLAAALLRVADECGKVFVPCVVGNHGRTTLKPRMKGRVFQNYEWNIYTDLEDRLRHDKRIQFHIPGETDAYFSVLGHRFLLTHGDTLGVKGGDGIIGAIGPIMRGTVKVGRSEAQIGREFDTIVMGHWHQYISTRGVIVNNCLKGYDEFARLALRAPATPASQALWFVHRKFGINTAMEVYVQDPEPFHRGPKNGDWISVFKK